MVVLGLDLSITSTGYAFVQVDKGMDIEVLEHGKIVTKPKDFECEDERINYIVNEIFSLYSHRKKDVSIIGVENQFISGRTSTIMVLRKLLGAVCRMAYHECKLDIEYIAPTSVKKTITGSGRAKKDEVANIIREKVIDIGEYSDKAGKNKTSDIYDAIAVALSIYERVSKNKIKL